MLISEMMPLSEVMPCISICSHPVLEMIACVEFGTVGLVKGT